MLVIENLAHMYLKTTVKCRSPFWDSKRDSGMSDVNLLSGIAGLAFLFVCLALCVVIL